MTAATIDTRRVTFELPAQLEATEPAEVRGITRDAVRMMVAYKREGRLVHSTFSDLPRHLESGDLVVVNTSGTLAAAVDVPETGLTVHLSTRLPADLWVVELRRGPDPYREGHACMTLALPGGGAVELLAPYGRSTGRLWVAALRLGTGERVGGSEATGARDQPAEPLLTYLAVHGRPIRYGYVRGSWPITMYQNVYANEPGSAEMPSAGRPFTPEVITRLVAKGVGFSPLVLHTGVSSLESHEAPYAEYFRVPAHTAHQVNDTHREGGRVLAIGTTVVRALETVADDRGRVHPGEGWTETIITPSRGVRAVDGLLTGWHEPEASHLDMLEAIAGRPLVESSYKAALEEKYLWHEFGDVHLILP